MYCIQLLKYVVPQWDITGIQRKKFIETKIRMLTNITDTAGNIFGAVEIRLALTQYAADILAYWTKEFGCSTAALIFLYIMEDQFRAAAENGVITTPKKYTVRALEIRSGISKSTVHRKLKHLENFGVIKLVNSAILLQQDDNGAVILPIRLPLGKKMTDDVIAHLTSKLRSA